MHELNKSDIKDIYAVKKESCSFELSIHKKTT